MLATPYFQLRFDSVPSTQDVARENFDDLPLVVVAAAQTGGRGRSGTEWQNADRALAVSLIFGHDPDDARPFSLLAGVAVVRALDDVRLKWPNDVLADGQKVGGILVERDDETTVVGFGLNLWWASPPEGMTGLYESDPGPDRHVELGTLWAAELMELVDSDDWPLNEYRERCSTIGQDITWEPDGSGRATDVAPDGALIVEVEGKQERIVSGAVTHVRTPR